MKTVAIMQNGTIEGNGRKTECECQNKMIRSTKNLDGHVSNQQYYEYYK